MVRRRLIWKLWPSYMLAVVACLSVTMFTSLRTARGFLERETATDLERAARILSIHFAEILAQPDREDIGQVCQEAGNQSGVRVTVIAPGGLVVADSDADPERMENHGNRPEIMAAFEGRVGKEQPRFSETLRQSMVYVAVPIWRAGEIIGVCRAAKPIEYLAEVRQVMANRILLSCLVAVLIGLPFTLYISRRILTPIRHMQDVAARLTGGDFSARMPMPAAWELADLAEAVNAMAAELSRRIESAVKQHEEVGAILGSMSEGLVAIDGELQMLRVNGAAERLLQVSRDEVLGMGLVGAVRNPALHRVAQSVFSSTEPVEEEVALHRGTEEVFLQVRASRLTMPGSTTPSGAVMVLTDVTRLKRLENLRREFAANVSHELRTPVTSIQGFVETLRDGAIDDRENAMRFLEIIHAQVERLGALISDLLSLACIEKQGENGLVRLARQPLKSHLTSLLDALGEQARKRQIQLSLTCPTGVEAAVNPGLFEQAIRNLVDNAIKYSEEGAQVGVAVEKTAGEVRIAVLDEGHGIAAEHLERLFERFYRVDKARSRDRGGTGLGLAIVKHVAQYHGGRVEVQSEVGKGSVFTLVLPAV
jgi:two-component system, OmpR family, phosphate regulon sensor histidine kinase PhoR